MTNNKIIPTHNMHGEKIGDILAGIIVVSDSLFKSLQSETGKEDVSGNLCSKLLEENNIEVQTQTDIIFF